MSETFEKKLWNTSIFRGVAGCTKFFKGLPAFKLSYFFKTSFADILSNMQYAKEVFQKQSTKIDLKVPAKSCDKIDDDMMKFIV